MAVNLISFNSNTTTHQENGELARAAKCLVPPANAGGRQRYGHNREVELDDDGDTLDVDERKMLKADWEWPILWSSAAQKPLPPRDGRVLEFAPVQDATAVFELETMYSRNLYLLCTAYRDRNNTLSGKGCWYLSMSQQGHLTGNGNKCEQSQWLLLEEEVPPVSNGVVGVDGSTTVPSSESTGNTDSGGVSGW